MRGHVARCGEEHGFEEDVYLAERDCTHSEQVETE